MANGKKPKDPYSAYTAEYEKMSGGDIGAQYLKEMSDKERGLSSLDRAAEALAGVPEAGKEAFQASKKDALANLASEQYRRRRTPIGAALTAAEQRSRTAQRQFGAQEADMAKMALQERSVAELAKAKAAQERVAAGTEAEKNLEAMTAAAGHVETMKAKHDDWFNADQDTFYNEAKAHANMLPPHLRYQFMEMYVMPTYRDWGGNNQNPFTPGAGDSAGTWVGDIKVHADPKE